MPAAFVTSVKVGSVAAAASAMTARAAAMRAVAAFRLKPEATGIVADGRESCAAMGEAVNSLRAGPTPVKCLDG